MLQLGIWAVWPCLRTVQQGGPAGTAYDGASLKGVLGGAAMLRRIGLVVTAVPLALLLVSGAGPVALASNPVIAKAEASSAQTAQVTPVRGTNLLGRLSAAWWTYVIQHLDTFASAACAPSGTPHLWFLFGTMDNQPRAGTCNVPPGSRLFFPLATQVAIDTPPVFGNGSLRDLHQCAADLALPASDLHLSVDGVSVNESLLFALRAPSPTFYVDMTNFGFAGTFPAASDGYWVLLPPLSPGTHTLQFGGTVPPQTSALANCGPAPENIQNITYTLNVAR